MYQHGKGEKRTTALKELDVLKAKRRVAQASVIAMTKSADQLPEEAEKSGKLTLLAQSNGMRRAAKAKTSEVQQLDKDVAEKEKAIKDLS